MNSKMRRWEVLYHLLKNREHNIGAEIGVLRGAVAKYLLGNMESLENLICVDPWVEYPDYKKAIGKKKIEKTDFEDIYQKFLSNVKKYKNKVTIYRMFSSEAARYIEDESLDFIFIDANHTYEYIKEDIELWYPKVKKGGLVSGHDYKKSSKIQPDYDVNRAVEEFFGKNGFSIIEERSIWYLEK